MALDLQHANHAGIEFAVAGSELRATVTGGGAMLEAVAGGAGFVNVSGAVTLDLLGARNFLQNVTGNVTSTVLANVPAAATWVAPILLAIKFADPGYMYSSFLSGETVVWEDGRSTADLDKTGGVNLITLVKVDGVVHVTLRWNGAVSLDPYVLSFPTNGVQGVPITQAESLDLSAVTNLELDGTAGTGTLTYQRGRAGVLTAATGLTALQSNDVLVVTLASATTASVVSIPRTV